MKNYLVLDIVTIILALIGVGMFYGDLFGGGFNWIVTLYFVFLAIGYVIVINRLHLRTKKIMEKLADEMGCEFEDTGNFSLTHYIRCEDVEIKVTLRGSYTPASMHMKLKGNFEEAVLKGTDEQSRILTQKLRNIEKKYGIKVNDAYTSISKAEIIITKYPEDVEVLKEIIADIKNVFRV